jgi:hypothetical protein
MRQVVPGGIVEGLPREEPNVMEQGITSGILESFEK